MGIMGLNVCVGIDAGTNSSKVAYFDVNENSTKIIAELENFNLLALREEAEIYFDEPIFSCVISVSDNFSRRQKDDVIFSAKKSGFKNVNLITSHEAVKMFMSNNNTDINESILTYDFGASKSDITLFNYDEIIEDEIIDDVCGNEFDKIFSEWLVERFTLNLIDKKILLNQAENIKITLSNSDYVTWRDVKILREDFERLIHFNVKRSLHTVEKFKRIYKPSRFILTGGCSNIPEVKKIFRGFEVIDNIIVKGAAIKAASISNDTSRNKSEKLNTALKIRELRGKLMELEEFLTRKQKDRLYILFRQAEGVSAAEPEIINFIENLINDILKSQD